MYYIIDHVKINDVISFYTCCNADREKFIGIVDYKEQLGFITIVNNVQYELRKLVDVEIIKSYGSVIHPQSGKESKSIIVLNKEFIYSDKRGFVQYTEISIEFAMEIINSFPVANGRTGKEIKFLDRLNPNYPIILKWNNLFDKMTIHGLGGHVWSEK